MEPTKITVEEFLNRWPENTAKLNVANNTYTRYKGLVEKQLIPHVGKCLLRKFQAVHVEQLYKDLEGGRHRLGVGDQASDQAPAD